MMQALETISQDKENLSYMLNTKAADDMTMQGAIPSAVMVSTQFSQILWSQHRMG